LLALRAFCARVAFFTRISLVASFAWRAGIALVAIAQRGHALRHFVLDALEFKQQPRLLERERRRHALNNLLKLPRGHWSSP
jgi:hypothetical protein